MTDVFASVTVHEVRVGGQMTGVASDGVDSGETLERGRLRVYTNGTVGGLFAAHAQIGMRVEAIAWTLTAALTPTVTISLIDMSGVAYQVESVSAASGVRQYGSRGLFLPPGCSLQVTSSAVGTAVGRVAVTAFRGWDQTMRGVMGKEDRPG